MAADVRERKPHIRANGPAAKTSTNPDKQRRPVPSEPDVGLSIVDILRVIAGLVLLNACLSYFITNDSFLWGWRPWFLNARMVKNWWSGGVFLTDTELSLYNGTDPALPIYLALNGTIYDVTAGARIYGPGGSYNIFAGKDAARGFITGCFLEDSTPDLRGVEWMYVPVDVPGFGERVDKEMKTYREQELRQARKKVKHTLDDWAKMFRGEKGKEYFEAGEVVREEGWLEKLPKRTLCEQAEKKRPQPRAAPTDPGAAYRGI